MADEEKVNNKEGSVSSRNMLADVEGKEICTNGFKTAARNGTIDGDINSASSSGEALRTYKRRKRTKIKEDEKLDMASTSQVNDQSAKEPHYKTLSRSSNMQAHITRKDPHEYWRNAVLQQMSQMLKCEGGLRGCIQDSVAYHLENCRTAAVKGSVHSCENGRKCTSQTGPTLNKLQSEVCGNEGLASSGQMQKANRCTGKELCQHTFCDIISSEKFGQLCHLLLKSFPGIVPARVLDISSIDSRMQEGAYEISPNLFHADLQQVWTKIGKIGSDLVALAKSLSDMSRASFHEQAGSVSLCSSEVGKHDELDMHDEGDWAQAGGTHNLFPCKICGEKEDVKNCLVCDSCEEMYHVACIEPAIEEIPQRSWYCASCTANGIGSPHGDCVVCERMNAPIISNHKGVCQESENHEDIVMRLEESSNGLFVDELQPNGGEESSTCIICRCVVEPGENLKKCLHDFCPHKSYHVTCLTSKQLKTHGPQWYCPSCLCGSCLTDCDDDKIVLCDGCDHAYHIYCMQPVLASIPEGKWFCRKCDADICRIREAKRSYQNKHLKLKKTTSGRKRCVNNEGTEKTVTDAKDNKSGGMDMLLTAAENLNYDNDHIATLGSR